MTAPARRALSCHDVVTLVTDYLEGALDAAASGLVEEHLAECPSCVTYVQQNRQTVDVLGRLQSPSLPQHMCDELVGAFRGWKQDR